MSHSKGSMAASCGTWRNKSSKRRAEVEPTSSLPVKSPCTRAHQSLKVLWLLPTISYCGKHLCHLHSPHCREPPLWAEQLTSAAPPTPVPEQSPRPKRWHPSPDPVESMPLGRTTPKATVGGPPAPRGKRSLPGSEHSSQAACQGI